MLRAAGAGHCPSPRPKELSFVDGDDALSLKAWPYIFASFLYDLLRRSCSGSRLNRGSGRFPAFGILFGSGCQFSASGGGGGKASQTKAAALVAVVFGAMDGIDTGNRVDRAKGRYVDVKLWPVLTQ